MKTFVICHNERLRRGFPFPVEWIMVGNHNVFSDGIIARELPKNIEKRANLLAYTAWYALVKNDFIDPDEFYLVVEYDVELSADFMDVVGPLLIPGRVIGFSKSPIEGKLFLGSRIMDLMIRSIKETYQVDTWEVAASEATLGRGFWCPSSNCIIWGGDMISYTNWFEKLLPFYSRKPASAHYHERALRIWMALNNIEPLCVENILRHDAKMSHRIRFPMMERGAPQTSC